MRAIGKKIHQSVETVFKKTPMRERRDTFFVLWPVENVPFCPEWGEEEGEGREKMLPEEKKDLRGAVKQEAREEKEMEGELETPSSFLQLRGAA